MPPEVLSDNAEKGCRVHLCLSANDDANKLHLDNHAKHAEWGHMPSAAKSLLIATALSLAALCAFAASDAQLAVTARKPGEYPLTADSLVQANVPQGKL